MDPPAGVLRERLLRDGLALHLDRDSQGRTRAEGWVEIEAPRETVWKILIDCDKALEYVPDMEACRVLESGPGHDITLHKVDPSWLLPSVSYRFRADYRHPSHIRVTLKGGDIDYMRGHWVFLARGPNCTWLGYRAAVDYGWMASRAYERDSLAEDVPEMMRRLRDLAEAAVE